MAPRPRKIVGKVAKCPAGRRLLAGQRRGAYWWRTEGFGMGLLPRSALRRYSSTSWPVSAASLMALEVMVAVDTPSTAMLPVSAI